MSPDLDVAVIGAGIAGLTTAHELQRAGLSVRVYEKQRHVGGRMRSFRHDGYTIDEGAEQLPRHGYRATWELIERLGVPEGDVPRIGGRLGMWRGARARPGVAEPSALLTGAGLGPRARLDLARFLAQLGRQRAEFDADHPERTPLGTTTVKELAGRYHSDLHDYLLQPVAGSFFGWDTARSAAAPMLSLLLDAGGPASWHTYASGMDLLARRLAAGLDVVTGSEVHEVVADRDSAGLRIGGGVVTARAAVLCVPAPVAARLHANPSADEAAYLSACTFTPTLKVSCLLDRPLGPRAGVEPLYLLLTPDAEDSVLSGVIADHVKHSARAPAGKGLLTLIAHPRTIPELLAAPEREVVERLTKAARRYVPGLEKAGMRNFVHAFPHGLPEATPTALRRRPSFMARATSPVEYAGDWVMLRPSSEGAVRAGALAASRVLSRLRGPRPHDTTDRETTRETA
ncbi:protoporphyrinogen/coproporphyrinogen oxidase [Streptomyces violens]|uniref:protoporphyrinogen/coproporphyrinogen oxidase n=1 Tax=Streptomyces violens TaxID=66377 RepID=UPI0004C1C4E0|nr:NAD(P)/FAD-dependent oxidoreductase [Streptomyces violens]